MVGTAKRTTRLTQDITPPARVLQTMARIDMQHDKCYDDSESCDWRDVLMERRWTDNSDEDSSALVPIRATVTNT